MKENKMDYKQMTAPCGLGCFICPIYIMQTKGDPRNNIIIKLLSKTVLKGLMTLFKNSKSENIRKLQMFDRAMKISKEKPICNGCRNENGLCRLHDMVEPCNVYRCTEEKNIDFCYQCSEFPCDHLHPYSDMAPIVPHNTKVFNLCLIKNIGVEKWAKEKAKDVQNTYYKSEWKL